LEQLERKLSEERDLRKAVEEKARLEQLERKLSEERDLRKAVEEKARLEQLERKLSEERDLRKAVEEKADALESKLNASESGWNSGELNYRPRPMLTNQSQRAPHTGESLDGDKHKAAWQVLRQSLRRHN